MKSVLKIENVKKYYYSNEYEVKAVDGISFEIAEGEFLGIMGPSGSGKSTLLNVISTIDNITSGEIYIKDKGISQLNKKELASFRREKLGFIFQDFNLLDTLSIYDNIAIALTINKIPLKQIREKVLVIARQMGIEDILNKFPYEVSGGQKQRCACARAMVTQPQLILADEPTGALDSNTACKLLEQLTYMNESLGANILMVTHDVFSASYCKRILFMKDGQIYKELIRDEVERKEFFTQILEVLAQLGGKACDIHKIGHKKC
ncbi:ABC transporter ATP-binding protein [Clostridium sp.]|uniref:ABC transporter ATP-binding protein n=1 Tax=Clostridium sp. TaxID=1506 RepID=UPI003F38D684